MTGRTIPEPVQRQVRQECGFGCVICGAPFFHYDHIDDYATTHGHEPSNLALLCPNHHQEKSSGRLSKEVVRELRAAPFNKSGKSPRSHEWIIHGDALEFRIGNNVYGSSHLRDGEKYVAMKFRDTEIFSVRRDGSNLLLSIFINDMEGNEVLRIVDNEMFLGQDLWDFDFSGTTIKIRSKAHQSRVIQFRIDPSAGVVFISETRFRFSFYAYPRLNPFYEYREIIIQKDSTIILPSKITISGFHSYVGRIGMHIT